MGDQRGTRVYVGNLTDKVKKDDLEEEFTKYGKLNSVWIALNPPGFAFVEFEHRDCAEKACDDLNGSELLGSQLRVEISKDRRGRGGGDRGGRRDYDRRGGGGGYRRDNGGGGGGGGRYGDRSYGSGGRSGGGGYSGGGRDYNSGGRSGGGYSDRGYGSGSRPGGGSRDGGSSQGGGRYRSRSPAGHRF